MFSDIGKDEKYEEWQRSAREDWPHFYHYLPFKPQHIYIDILHAQLRITERVCVLLGMAMQDSHPKAPSSIQKTASSLERLAELNNLLNWTGVELYYDEKKCRLRAKHSFRGQNLVSFWQEGIFQILEFTIPEELCKLPQCKSLQDKKKKFIRIIQNLQIMFSMFRSHRLLSSTEIDSLRYLGRSTLYLLQDTSM